KNSAGTGTGKGQVEIPSFPPGPLDISTGNVAISRIVLGQGTALPPRPATFERDVYHWFKDEGCSAVCHAPGPDGVGYVKVRMDADGNMYHADWSASVDDVYANLTKPIQDGCDTNVPARVCLVAPAKSLLYLNPTGMAMHPGRSDLPPDGPMMTSILK